MYACVHVVIVRMNVNGVFVGSGSDGLTEPQVTAEILGLTDGDAKELTVVYLGTASYDSPQACARQVCSLHVLDL